jgi:hypothetical protein
VLLLSATALLGHLVLFLVAARIAGSSAPFTQLVPLMLLALLVMGLPLNVGGWGPREAVSALVFGAAGLGASQGLTVAVVYGLLALIASLPGAGVLAFRRSSRKAQPLHVAARKRIQARRLGPLRTESEVMVSPPFAVLGIEDRKILTERFDQAAENSLSF